MPLILIRDTHQLDQLEPLKNARIIALDLETAGKNGLQPAQSYIRLMQCATDQGTFVIDLKTVQPPDWLLQKLQDNDSIKILHNAKFDLKHLYHHFQIEVRPVFCTFLASQLVSMGFAEHRHNLAAVVHRYLRMELDKSQQDSDWDGNLSEEQIMYAARDVETLLKLYPILDKKIKRLKLGKVSQLEFKTVMPVAAMELVGMKVNLDAWEKQQVHWEHEAKRLEAEILGQIGFPGDLPGINTLNLNAPEQVLQSLNYLGADLKNTSESELRRVRVQFPIAQTILEFRHASKLSGTTFKNVKSHVLQETGRIHPSYFQIASASGRFACSEPNIQQIPREREIRQCFIPEEGNVFIVADYSQVELRVAAGLAQDKVMLDAYESGQDLHKLTAALTKGKEIESIDKIERQAAKAINFGLIYAMGPRGLMLSARNSYGVEMSIEEAEKFRERYFQHYSGIKAWQGKMERIGVKNRYIRTAAGRIRSYATENIKVTELFNVPVQGTAAEGLKSALCIFWNRKKERGLNGHVIAIIHDEIIVECPKTEAQETRVILEESMKEGIQWLVPNVPFEVEAHIGTSWAEKG